MPKLLGVALTLALLIAACGDDSSGSGSALVDPEIDPPINSLEVDPAGDALLLTTNRGFFRIEDGEASRVKAEASTPDGKTAVGTFLVVAADGDELVGSGHPDQTGRIADFLGSMRSTDGGRSWRVTSRYSIADLHVFQLRHGKIYAFDAVIGTLLVSDDGGRSWTEHGGPPEQVVDFVVDPDDPEHLLASTRKEIFRSTDGGRRWSATAAADSARLAWPEAGTLRRIDASGTVYASENGSGWESIGRIDGEPWRLQAASAGRLFAALADATILVSDDAGARWREHFSP